MFNKGTFGLLFSIVILLQSTPATAVTINTHENNTHENKSWLGRFIQGLKYYTHSAPCSQENKKTFQKAILLASIGIAGSIMCYTHRKSIQLFLQRSMKKDKNSEYEHTRQDLIKEAIRVWKVNNDTQIGMAIYDHNFEYFEELCTKRNVLINEGELAKFFNEGELALDFYYKSPEDKRTRHILRWALMSPKNHPSTLSSRRSWDTTEDLNKVVEILLTGRAKPNSVEEKFEGVCALGLKQFTIIDHLRCEKDVLKQLNDDIKKHFKVTTQDKN